jgi:Homeodomain-like domain
LVKHNGLNPEARAKCLHLLAEGSSIRSAARILGISKTTILKLIEDAGRAAAWYQDRVFQNLNCKKIQADELWGFCGAKAANASQEKKARGEQGDIFGFGSRPTPIRSWFPHGLSVAERPTPQSSSWKT